MARADVLADERGGASVLGGSEPGTGTSVRNARRDFLWLGALIALSLAPHRAGLGFYSDDWDFIGRFVLSDGSFAGLFDALHVLSRERPGETLYDTALYWLFGLDPLGYHLVNAGVVVATGLLFYQVLRELGQSRAVSLAVALLYAVLPHYSTDRIWYASYRAALSILLYLVSLVAGLRAVRGSGRDRFLWGGLSLTTVLASGLCYEAAVPLFLLNAALLAWRGGRALPALTVAAVGAVVGFKLLTSERVASGLNWEFVAGLARQSLRINGWIYGLAAPRTFWRAVIAVPPVDLVVAVLLLGGTYWALRGITDAGQPPSRRAAVRLLLGGLVVTVLAHLIFVAINSVVFSATGDSNRFAIAWAGGIAIMVVGAAVGLVARVEPPSQARAFGAIVAVLVAAAYVTSARLTYPWVDAYREQRRVIGAIRQTFRTLPSGTTLFLDGECSYIGPGVVFEAPWDLRGVLWWLYRDSTLRGEVVTRRFKVRQDGIRVSDPGRSYGSYPFYNIYPYGRMTIFDIRRRTVHQISDSAAAEAYFAAYNPNRSSGCPRTQLGEGIRPF